jgi:tellurite methyltransferase
MNPSIKENSKEWWQDLYSKKDCVYGKEPSSFLYENIKELRKGKVLDIACGEGRNAIYLASKGFDVDAIDFSETAIERGRKFASDSGVQVNFQLKDLDMFLFPLMGYETILITDYHPNLRLLKDINRGLTKGGLLIVDAYTVEQLKVDGPKVEFFECFKPNEVLQNLRNMHVSFYQEKVLDGKHARVQCIARKTTMVS